VIGGCIAAIVILIIVALVVFTCFREKKQEGKTSPEPGTQMQPAQAHYHQQQADPFGAHQAGAYGPSPVVEYPQPVYPPQPAAPDGYSPAEPPKNAWG